MKERGMPWLPVAGVLVAIAITASMDASGLSAFSALPLLPLAAVLWLIQRFSRSSVGLVWGRLASYWPAAAFPVAVIGTLAATALVAGAIDLSHTDWSKAWLNLAIVSLSTFLVAILTEEGFFRGWLWASLERSGSTRSGVVLWSSVAFALWHVSAVTLPTGFDLPAAQVPVFLVNAAVLGAVWGLLRARSGSLIVSSLSHGLWNGLAYVFFGYGTKAGALGVADTARFGPEVGLLGLALNCSVLSVSWWWWKGRRSDAPNPG